LDTRIPLTPFHLAIPVADIHLARQFYAGVLGCSEGRSAEHWVDFNLFGHQLVCHEVADSSAKVARNPVDGDAVPIPHFGVVLEMPTWEALAEKLRLHAVRFIIEPHVRFAGQAGEQATMFLADPSGNHLEFKAFRNLEEQLFQR